MSATATATATATGKRGRNDVCSCGSGKKYKKCCLLSDEDSEKALKQFEPQQQQLENPKIYHCMQAFKPKFSQFKMIDVTPFINARNYKKYQLKFLETATILFAEKTSLNQDVFRGRVNSPESDILIMYKGAYRTCKFDDLSLYFDSICRMIHYG